MKVKVVIELIIECNENSDALRAVDTVLDAGKVQDAINEANAGTDYARVRVLTARTK